MEKFVTLTEQLTKKALLDGFDIEFHYVVHSIEHAETVWNRVKGADVILMECVKPTSDEKRICNELFKEARRTPEESIRNQIIDMFYDPETPKFDGHILKQALEARKHFRYIDVTGEMKEIDHMRKFDALLDTAFKFLLSGQSRSALKLYKSSVKHFGESVRDREKSVAEEIANLKKEFAPYWQRKKIAIIQGAVHTPTYYLYKVGNPNDRVSRSLPQDRFYFHNIYRLLRYFSMKPKVEISEKEYIRAFMAQYIIEPLVTEDNPNLPRSVLGDRIDEISLTVDDNELLKYWKLIGEAERELPNRKGTPEYVLAVLKHVDFLNSISEEIIDKSGKQKP